MNTRSEPGPIVMLRAGVSERRNVDRPVVCSFNPRRIGPATRCIFAVCAALTVGCSGAASQNAADGTSSASAVDFNRRPDGHFGPWIGAVTVVKASGDPLRVDFTIRLRDANGDYPTFPAESSLWLCLGTPKQGTFHEALAAALKDYVWRDGVATVRGKDFANSVNFLSGVAAFNVPDVSGEVARGFVGPGYAGFVCHDMKRNDDGSYSASMSLPARKYSGDRITLSSPKGNESLDVDYPAAELPVSWVLWSEVSDTFSNERRGVLDLKSGHIVRLFPD
jgi:hypothetical protein